MTEFELKHGLSQDEPGPLEPVELAQQDDTLARTGNTARDWELTCHKCDGSGHVYVKHQVADRKTDIQEFKEECDCCEGRGFVFAFQDIPGIEEYVKTCRPAPAAPGVSTVEQDERSATHGMTLGERIAHVGGRTNAQGYIEFGSPMAVDALIQHVLRDIDCTRQEDDGAYQARYRLPGGQWSSWGHVVCGVKGHEQELRYLPGERHPAPAAGDARADRDAAFEAVRKRLCALPRYSFWNDDNGGVKRVNDRSGNWIEFDAAHGLFDAVAVDAAIAAQQGKGGAA
ncbi:hypothetical protein ACOTBX_10555 [Achromobacter xylosoxidans]